MILRAACLSFLCCALSAVFCIGAAARPAVRPGIDVLLQAVPAALDGSRVGLITNQTGVSSTLVHSRQLLNEHPAVNLTALFAPEHGLTGSVMAGREVESSTDDLTGLRVFSLYEGDRRPTPAMLEEIDVLLFDIQDIGTRWYTYISTMARAMEAAAAQNKIFIVLDRPNPLGGIMVDGPVLGDDYKSFVGMFRVPVVHGMTVGELALLYKSDNNLDLDLRVIRMDGWNRAMTWPDTGLNWVPTSPHIPSFASAATYPGLGLLGEVGMVSVGVGYTLPFQVAGAPWLSPYAFADRLNALGLPGVYFAPAYYAPFFGMFRERLCGGVQLHVTDHNKYQPLTGAMHMLEVLRDMHPEHFRREFNSARRRSFNLHLGTDAVAGALTAGRPLGPVMAGWDRDLERFRERREQFLLY